MFRKLLFVFAILVLLVSISQPALAAGTSPTAPIYGADSATAIAGRYIVVFKPGTAGNEMVNAVDKTRGLGGEIHYKYSAALNGFAASLPEQALKGLVHNPNVAYIEVDQVVTIDATQTGATWGLDRIDQRALPLSTTYTYNYTGAGVTAYIIDTGILFSPQPIWRAGRLRLGFCQQRR